MGKGTIVVIPKTARLVRDINYFATMDPYVKLKYNGVKQKTKVDKNGGKNPSWNETFSFKETDCTLMYVAVWNENTFSHEVICEAKIDIPALISHGAFKDWVKMNYKGKEAGELW